MTSLPDVSEVGLTLPVWREWFLAAVQLVVAAVPDDSAAIFFQSDIKRDGCWIDKGARVISAAEAAGARVLFHKLICRRPPGTLTLGRPGYTHMIAVSRALRCSSTTPGIRRSRRIRPASTRTCCRSSARREAGRQLAVDALLLRERDVESTNHARDTGCADNTEDRDEGSELGDRAG